jgi:flagellar basal-body rod protein FlgF
VNYGMHLSATGAMVSLHRMDVLANNLANVGTVGFKAEMVSARQRHAARVEDGLGFLPSNELLERLGGGVLSGPTRVSPEQGTLRATGNPLDVAIEGNGFFVVGDESAGGDGRRLTRDGRFAINPQGLLALASGGAPVMDATNRPIQLGQGGEVQIGSDGSVRQGGLVVGQLQLVNVADPASLVKVGNGQFRAAARALGSNRPVGGQVRQGMVEESSVDPIAAMLGVTEAGRAAEANLAMIRNHDRVMDRAINSLGRVA